MTRSGTPPDDPLSGFPAEAEVGRRSWRSRFLRAVLTVAVGAVALIIVLVVAAPRIPDGERPAATGDPAVRIESAPAGARVSLAGRDLGVTPLSLSLPPGAHTLTLQHEGVSRDLLLQLVPGTQVVYHVEMPRPAIAGTLPIETTPAGARVLLDGTPRGTTPLEIAGVEPGEHRVRLEVTAAARDALRPPQSGWLSVASPIELHVLEGGALVGNSRMDRIVLRAGEHRLRLVNASLGFESEAVVSVRPGEATRTVVNVPSGAIFVNAVPWAEVLVDGMRVGDTPIANHPVPIGAHEVTLRNPRFPEQRRRVTVTRSNPVRLGVDMRR